MASKCSPRYFFSTAPGRCCVCGEAAIICRCNPLVRVTEFTEVALAFPHPVYNEGEYALFKELWQSERHSFPPELHEEIEATVSTAPNAYCAFVRLGAMFDHHLRFVGVEARDDQP